MEKEFKPYISNLLEKTKNPFFRFRLALICFDESRKKLKPDNVQNLYSLAIEAARHLFRFSGLNTALTAIATLEIAAYLASKYPSIVQNVDGILCTIRYALHQDLGESLIKCELANLLLHFLDHPKWHEMTVADITTESMIIEIRKEWVFAVFLLDVFKVERIRDILMDLFVAIDRKDYSDDVWNRSKDLLLGFATDHPSAIANGMLERLLQDGKSRLKTEERKELIKAKRASIKTIVDSFKPIYFPTNQGSESLKIVNSILAESNSLDKLLHLFKVPFMLNDSVAKDTLKKKAFALPLQSTLEAKRIIGDRDDGGTDVDPEFRTNELQMQQVSLFMVEIAYPVISSVAADIEALLQIFKSSTGWDDDFTLQCKRTIQGFLERDAVQCLFYGISFLEGFLGRAIDRNGASVDRERHGGKVTHRSMLDSLFEELPKFGFENDEVKIYKLIFLEGGAGWNIRNLIYHGLAEDRGFSEVKATALLYVLLKLTVVFKVN